MSDEWSCEPVVPCSIHLDGSVYARQLELVEAIVCRYDPPAFAFAVKVPFFLFPKAGMSCLERKFRELRRTELQDSTCIEFSVAVE